MEGNLLARRWWSYLLRGLLAIAFGIILLAWPGATVLVLLVVFGIFAVIDGIVDVILAIALASDKQQWGWTLVKGVVGLLIGIVILTRPDVALTVVVVLIAIWAILSGFIELAAAFDMPPDSGRGFVGLFGAISVIVGVLLLAVPFTTVFVFIVIVGIYAIVAGIIGFILSFVMRKWQKEAAAA
jgi:uncharacterized membrane protein HdeD (DUF308 family)